MSQRRSPEELIQGLNTTSDRIRALAHAGYDRTEISKILGIRYQHVRNVLLGSGITGGLRREAQGERHLTLARIASKKKALLISRRKEVSVDDADFAVRHLSSHEVSHTRQSKENRLGTSS